ncbi:MAG: GspH/FimT family pseudopilin [Hylemonella sp.]|nr:GspH/FimT family pseudopilin [Hylemonella sp.]
MQRSLHMRGFSLVELLVVFAVLGLVVSVTPPVFEKIRESAQYRDVLRIMISDMRSARQQAASEGREIRFQLDLASRRFGLDGRPQHDVPPRLLVRATIANQELAPDGMAAIRFLPEGGATGGSIEVIRSTGSGARLRVDWMSGRITQEPLVP